MWQTSYKKHVLDFKFLAGTSRGTLIQKDSYMIQLSKKGSHVGLGEASLLPNLSIDHTEDFESKLQALLNRINQGENWQKIDLKALPSIQFALEMAQKDWEMGGKKVFYDNAFSKGQEGIPINGLIWMGKKEEMYAQIRDKIAQGFGCIKMKIGALEFEEELQLLQYIRTQFSAEEMVLRVDANGAFSPQNALEKLKRLADLQLHSIEQPIKQGNIEEMAKLCASSPLPIALDEELIGISDRKKLLDDIKPQYIVLKPSLLGGWNISDEWINLATKRSIGWWVTSALESNIGLNAIAQWTADKSYCPTATYQGLGTGQLFSNNIKSPLTVSKGLLWHHI